MSQRIGIHENFEEYWETLQPTLSAWEGAFDQTIRPEHPSYADLLKYISLPTLELEPEGSRKQELSLGETLGEGGMGIVTLAKQVSLNREVAIKRVREERSTPEVSYKLLQEAWVTGLLEHPNIIPVHQLGQDAEGQPLMVMKRISGTSWREILHGEAELPSHFGEQGDELKGHLDVLLQVCHGVQFAHSKGIIHRDIKPENVMLGEHGEVYLVDWGLALSLNEQQPHLPQASRTMGIAGTPAYLAPEMAMGDGGRLNEATDIYLLGATLHELITGAPPHLGGSLQEVFFQVFREEPRRYGEGVPEELAAICRKAMHPNPLERYESADAFRQALVFYLEHRHSLRMSTEASQRLYRLCQMMEKAELSAAEKLEIYTLFGHCRFGFEEALRIWEDNLQAREGYQAALEAMAEFELGEGSAQAAAVLLAQMPQDNPALQSRLEVLQRELREEEREFEALKQFQRELDLSVGAAVRSIHVMLLGLFWTLETGLVIYAERALGWHLQHHHYILGTLGILCTASASAYFKRDFFLQNAANRRIIGTFLLATVGLIMLGLMSIVLGIPVKKTFVLSVLVLFLIFGMMALTVDRRLIWPAALYLLTLVLTTWQPAYVFEILLVANFLGFSMLAYIWKPEQICHDDFIESLVLIKGFGQISKEGRERIRARLEALGARLPKRG